MRQVNVVIPLEVQSRLSIAALEFCRVERVWATCSYTLDYAGWRAAARDVDEVTAELKEAARAYEQALADQMPEEPTLKVHDGPPLNEEWACPLCSLIWVKSVDELQGRCLNCKPITDTEAKRMHLQSVPDESV